MSTNSVPNFYTFMEPRLLRFIIILIMLGMFGCSRGKANKGRSEETSNLLRVEEIKREIKKKHFSVFYFWVSWCGISQDGLRHDYYQNLKLINNDSIQSFLIVMSDTSSIKKYLTENEIMLPYKCYKEEQLSIFTRNISDGNNKEVLLKELFSYKAEFSGFPGVIMVDSNFHVLYEGTKVENALRKLKN